MYTTGDILLKVPGISRDILYNWIDRGYLVPIHTPIGDKGYRRKKFSEADYLKIRLMWKFNHEQRLPPRIASLKADEFLSRAPLLSLSVEKTFRQAAFTSGVLRLSPTEPFDVIATVEAYKVESCGVSVSFDPQYLSLVTGNPDRRLQLDVYDEIDLNWGFRAEQETGAQPIDIHITAQAGETMRVVSIPVEVGD